MVDAVLALPEGTKLMVLAPVARGKKGEFADLLAQMQAAGYVRFRVGGQVLEAADVPALKKTEKHDINVESASRPAASPTSKGPTRVRRSAVRWAPQPRAAPRSLAMART